MAERWVGFTVAVKCKEAIGAYEGVIDEVNCGRQTLTLSDVIKDGKPYKSYKLIIKAHDIENVIIIKEAKQMIHYDARKILSKRTQNCPVDQFPMNKSKQSFPAPKYNKINCFALNRNDRTYKKPFVDQDLVCSNSHTVPELSSQDFDFQKSLVLFDKESSEKDFINNHCPDIIRQAERSQIYHPRGNSDKREIILSSTKAEKFISRDNLMVSKMAPLPSPIRYSKTSLNTLKSEDNQSSNLRQILVSSPGAKEYVTNDGLIIPSITSDLRRRLIDMAEDQGLSFERQNEMIGHAACELVLQLLDKSLKFNLSNSQWQRVVVMCGSHRQGAIGINCARQLTAHGLNVFVYLMEPSKFISQVAHELALYRLTNNNTILDISELPTTGVGLIVIALADEHTVQLPPPISLWIQQNQAILLALDPPPDGTPGLVVHYSILPALPLTHSPNNGHLFLANINIPQQIFTNVGIYYKSPFGMKSTIALHDYSHKC
ncbi:unnamed protein product [Bemisia tabaci]|uniref:Enhancer of mRNA-decapping protein 3 n=1 Tax=Bemisia tabaci TaxID=7038 RepID=A0A9P0ACI1_BEMTA|nr:unnamed protein product [Bemisia tabaci]